MRGIDKNDFYTGININQRIQYCHNNQNTKKWEWWTSIPIFLIEITNSLACFLINHCNHNKFQQTYYFVFYLMNLLLDYSDYSTIPYGFDIYP